MENLSVRRVLFVTWDGPQVAYLEGLFLPVFSELMKRGFLFRVVQFTWADKERVARTRATCEGRGVPYQAVKVWRRPRGPASVATALRGGRIIKQIARDHAVDVVMPRSTMPALATLSAGNLGGAALAFDADGLAVDERVDFAGLSPESLFYRVMRDVEAQMVRRARVVLTRSAKASDVLLSRAGAGTDASKFFVVGNGRDESLFHPQGQESRVRVRERLGIEASAPVVAYAGSIGKQYCPSEMLNFFSRVLSRRPDARLLVLSTSARELVERAAEFSIPAEAMVGLSVEADRVAEHLACADLGLALRAPSFSMQGVAPIKLGEYLLCGLPVVATAGVGNTAAISRKEGVLVESNASDELEVAASWFVDEVLPEREGFRERCREAGRRHFSLEATVESYRRALDTL